MPKNTNDISEPPSAKNRNMNVGSVSDSCPIPYAEKIPKMVNKVGKIKKPARRGNARASTIFVESQSGQTTSVAIGCRNLRIAGRFC